MADISFLACVLSAASLHVPFRRRTERGKATEPMAEQLH